MKMIVMAIIVLGLMAFTSAVLAGMPPEGCYLNQEASEDAGDPNCDGEVNALDALLVLQEVAGLIEFDNDYVWNMADADNDCFVTPIDAALILQYSSFDYFPWTAEAHELWKSGAYMNRFHVLAYKDCPVESGRIDVY